MKHNRLMTAAALAGCLLLPGVSLAQTANRGLGNGGYGIFGDGTNLNGVYNGGGGNTFSRNYTFGQSQIGNFAQAAYQGANITPLGSFGGGGSGSGSTLSPYLNLLRPGSTVVNYYSGVRPQQHQNYQDWATNYKFAERQGEEELRIQQGLQAVAQNIDWSQGYKQAEKEGEKEAKRRAGENPDDEYADWATSYKDQEIRGEAKAQVDRAKSKQRAANLRQAKELRELEAELSAGGDTNKQTATPALASGLQSYHGPLIPSQYKSMSHYYPTQGGPVGRIGGGGNR